MASRLLRLVPLAVIGWACSTGPSGPPPAEVLGRSESAIINGALDKAHPAVVALLLGKDSSAGGACTGTIVKRDAARGIGWVATAAHCIDSGVALVLQTEDYGTGEFIQYSVIDYEADPRYSSADLGYDFAIVRIGGVDASTPVIPLTDDPDDLAEGMEVTSVGFGTTGSGMNTSRRFVKKPLARVTPELLGYDQRASGVCFGDSGGPVIAGSGASARVVGIHSFVSGGCNREGYSARVTSALEFYGRQLAKVPEPSCAVCETIATGGTGTCAQLTTSCLNDDECRGYYECIGDGKKTAAECFSEFPISEGPFTAAKSCVCMQACADECAGEPSCDAVGKCGYKLDEEDACAACVESACCDEMRDCTVDGRCTLCLKRKDSFPSCKRNEPRVALAACASDKCASECAGSTLPTIGEPPPSEDADAGPPAPAELASGCSAARSPSAPGAWRGLAIAGLALAAFVTRRRRR